MIVLTVSPFLLLSSAVYIRERKQGTVYKVRIRSIYVKISRKRQIREAEGRNMTVPTLSLTVTLYRLLVMEGKGEGTP